MIASYLDLEFSSGNALYPDNPEEYAKARWFEMYSDTELTRIAYQKIFLEKVIKPHVLKQKPNTDTVDRALSKELPLLLQFLDASLDGKDWFVNTNFSMADIAIATQLLDLEMADYKLEKIKYPYLQRFLQRAKQRDSFRQLYV